MELTTEEPPTTIEEVSRSPRLLHRPLVYQAPEFSKRLNPLQELKVGDSVVFECQYKAFPHPTVRWFKDDQEITGSDERFRMDVNESDGQLRLSVATVTKADEGAYKCKVENQEGVASTTGYLSVTGDSANRPKSPSATASANGNNGNGNGNGGNKSPDLRSVSLPPLLRTIREQKSLEEREEKHQPEPFQPMLDGSTWPLLQMGYGPGWTDERKDYQDAQSSGSDTSVGSQELEDFGSFVLDDHSDLLGGAGASIDDVINRSDLQIDDLDLELDDEVFRKEPNVSIISSVPLNISDDDVSKDRAESSTSSDLFIVEADDLLSNYSNLSRDFDSGLLSGSESMSIENAIEVVDVAPVASSPPSSQPQPQTTSPVQQAAATPQPAPEPPTLPQPQLQTKTQSQSSPITSPQAESVIPTQPQPQPAEPPQPPITPQPQLQATTPISSETMVALETPILAPDAKIDTVSQPPATEKKENNRPNSTAADISTVAPLKMPEATAFTSPAHSVKNEVNKEDEVSRTTPTVLSTPNTVLEKPPTSQPAAESLYTRETVRVFTSDLAAILIVLISVGTFVGTSFGISPLYYVLLLSAASLICFQFFSAE